MKNIIKVFVAALMLVSCGDFEPVIYDEVNGQLGLGFNGPTLVSVTVPSEGVTVSVPVQATQVSSEARTFNVTVNAEESSGSASDYSVGTVTIPADSYDGELEVAFGNFTSLEDCVTYRLVVDLNLPGGTTLVGNDKLTFNYLREFECPDLALNITFDAYPGETSWQITDVDGGLVASGDDYGAQTSYSEDLCFCPGIYTFTIFDSFGDGICCAYGDGSYEIVYNGDVLISGGEFGADESQNFTID